MQRNFGHGRHHAKSSCAAWKNFNRPYRRIKQKRVSKDKDNSTTKRGSGKKDKNWGLMGWVVITYAPEKAKKTDKFSINIR
jgi:hypothetical protein